VCPFSVPCDQLGMLQVHPDSTCDVCLDHYSFTNSSKTPHAIPCGHIFCIEYVGGQQLPTETDCAILYLVLDASLSSIIQHPAHSVENPSELITSRSYMSTGLSLESERRPCPTLGVWLSVSPNARAAMSTYRPRTNGSERHNNGSKLTITRNWYDHSPQIDAI
jgi:hypothetical protein